VVEGESSLTAHSVFANDLLQKVMSKDSRPEMRERIEALRDMVESMKKQPAAHEMTYPHAKPIRPPALEGCELPPIDKTLQVLKLVKCRRPSRDGHAALTLLTICPPRW
jgi:anti-sigma factor ChrR (cupin superfamily)